jgi:hypothetical protein
MHLGFLTKVYPLLYLDRMRGNILKLTNNHEISSFIKEPKSHTQKLCGYYGNNN